MHPDDIPRFRRLRAVANAQPLWAAHEGQMDDLTIPFLGEPRWRWQYPFGSLVRSGAGLAMGSDWSVSSPDPLEEIHVAVNRVAPPTYLYGNGNAEVFLPDERLDLATAIAAFTMGSAYVNHLDDVTGSIEVGKSRISRSWTAISSPTRSTRSRTPRSTPRSSRASPSIERPDAS